MVTASYCNPGEFRYQLAKVRRCLDKTTYEHVINALVTSRLDFQNSVLLGLPECEVKRQQRAQNAAPRLLTGTKRWEHITSVLREIHWLPVTSRIQYKVLLITHKVLHCQDNPKYLRSCRACVCHPADSGPPMIRGSWPFCDRRACTGIRVSVLWLPGFGTLSQSRCCSKRF
jgi:hypothetical protein